MNRLLVLGAVVASAVGLGAGLFLSMHGIEAVSGAMGHGTRTMNAYWDVP